MSRLKTHAARTGRTLTAVMEEALRVYLASTRRKPKRDRIHLTTVGGKGLQPGVDIDNTADLLDRLDRSP